MTKAEIVEDIASKTGLTKKDVATAMDMFLESISKALSEGKHYEIRGFGTFKVKKRKSRMARNRARRLGAGSRPQGSRVQSI
jgi:nucleoid DNA-binding protein